MRLRKPVWTEGLFVTQHHFQQQDRYHESFVEARLDGIVPFAWGLADVEIDPRALEAGQVRATKLRGVLPDGTPFDCGEQSQDAPPARAIGSLFTTQMQSLPVYVAILNESDAGTNVDLDGSSSASARCAVESMRVFDYNTGTHEQGITTARPNLRLLLGSEVQEAFSALQIAELTRATSGAVVLRDTYIPPIFQIGTSPFLVGGMRRLLSAMTSRQRELAASRRQRSAAGVDFSASDSAKFWLLNTLNEAIPEFSHLVDQGTTHPEGAYLALGRLVGHLCTFAVDGDPTAIPRFNYLNLEESFEPLLARAVALLRVVIAERYVQIPLQRRSDGMYLGQIEDVSVRDYEFFLGVTGPQEHEVRDALPRLTKIASWQQIAAILNSAISGAQLEIEYRPPGALPLKPGLVMFRMNKTPKYWSDIQNTGTIAIYHPPAPTAIELALYAVDPKNL
ncbi:MAG: type VI secretion system baseplate subunit TssK [Polyangiaceae bacterium]|nr:type VI secretion system baseplate subunit TssK [Polyangiaceae bacterium]